MIESLAIAARHGVTFGPGQDEPISDEAFEDFARDYLRWSEDRDTRIRAHLESEPNLFRTHIPHSTRVFQIVSQIVWYMDEVIIRDPIVLKLTNRGNNIEQDKLAVRELLTMLSWFRHPIEAGYLLLVGSQLIPIQKFEPTAAVLQMAANPVLRKAIMEAAYCGATMCDGPDGNEQFIYQVKLDSGGSFGGSITVGPGCTAISIPVFQQLPRISISELRQKLGRDPFEKMDHIFAGEIQRAILSVERASSLGSAVLFDRRVDETILNTANVYADENRQVATVGVLDLTVPFLKNVPPDRLLELREQIPSAFVDFRARLHEIAKMALSAEGISAEELKAAAEAEVAPHIAALESELNSELVKARILKFKAPIVSAAAVLVGAMLSAPVTPLLGLGAAGFVSALKGTAIAASARALTKGKPFYFLWQAQNLSR